MENEENPQIRIGKRMFEYIKKVQAIFQREYGINVAQTEISNLIADRAEKNKLF